MRRPVTRCRRKVGQVVRHLLAQPALLALSDDLLRRDLRTLGYRRNTCAVAIPMARNLAPRGTLQ